MTQKMFAHKMTRTLEGKRYHFAYNTGSKTRARKLAKEYRQSGTLARIFPVKRARDRKPRSYDVFIHCEERNR